MTGQRIVSIWFPHFAIERWQRRQRGMPSQAAAETAGKADTRPLVLACEGPHGPIIHDTDPIASAHGIKRGARIVDMRALVPELRVENAALQTDARDLVELARWVRRWCPWSQVDGCDGLLLDTTGSAHLHGGEQAMAGAMRSRFAALGLTARIAIAATIGSAWALARHGETQPYICPDSETMRHLSPLPVEALRLDTATRLLLRRLGLKTVGALADVPLSALVRRFRHAEDPPSNPPLRLAQASGRTPEPLVSQEIVRPVRAIRQMAEPLGDLAGLERALVDLAGDLCALLEETGQGARRLHFTSYRVDGRTHLVEARTGLATREADHIVRMFDGKLDWIDPGFGIEAVALEAVEADMLPVTQDDLTGKRRENMMLAQLLDRLTMRLGTHRVLQIARHGSHIPERSEHVSHIEGEHRDHPRAVRRRAATPLRLLNRPEEAEVIHAVPDGPPARFRWRRKLHNVARSAGPERIAPEWWRERSTTRLRDYYHVEDSEGLRFWLFREGLDNDGRGGKPRWFVHGLDA